MLTLVMDAGMASPLLDLRFMRSLAGELSRGRLLSSLGSSAVALLLTPMLSVAVFTRTGALDLQLAAPESHFLLLGVCAPEVEGVGAGCEDAVPVDAAMDLSERASCSESVSLGVSAGVCAIQAAGGAALVLVLVLASSQALSGAGGFSFVFLRGLMATGRARDRGRQAGVCRRRGREKTCEPAGSPGRAANGHAMTHLPWPVRRLQAR